MLLSLIGAVWALVRCFNQNSVFMDVFETCCINFFIKAKTQGQTKSKTAQSCNRKTKI